MCVLSLGEEEKQSEGDRRRTEAGKLYVSGVLERMEKKGLIKRKVSKEDRRFVEIILTDKGNDLEEPILETVEEVNRIVLKDMGQQEQEALKESLRHLAGI